MGIMRKKHIALLLQPYKNRLVAKAVLKANLSMFVASLTKAMALHPTVRINVALPAYLLEVLTPLELATLRDLISREQLEILTCGYTEPFFNFFGNGIIEKNLHRGIESQIELTGIAPTGFYPPFSNWSGSFIAPLLQSGLRYIVLSSMVLPPHYRDRAGTWMAGSSGDTIPLIPMQVFHHYSAPADISGYCEKLFERDPLPTTEIPFAALQYLLPLEPDSGIDSFRSILHAVELFAKHEEATELHLLKNVQAVAPSLGILHLQQENPYFVSESGDTGHFSSLPLAALRKNSSRPAAVRWASNSTSIKRRA